MQKFIILFLIFVIIKISVNSGNAKEEYKYDLKFLFLNVGQQIFRIEEKSNFINLYLHIETLPFFSKIYKVNNTINTHVDKNTLLPIFVEKYTQEGEFRSHTKINFDYKNNQIYLVEKLLPGGKIHNEQKFKLEPKLLTFDFLGLIYYLMRKEIKQEDTLELGILTRHNIEKITIKPINYQGNTFLIKTSDADILIDKETKKILKLSYKIKFGKIIALLKKIN